MSNTYAAVYTVTLPKADQVVDPYHAVSLANRSLDEIRRRVQTQQLGHRGRKDDPLYRARRILLMAEEKLDQEASERLGRTIRKWFDKLCNYHIAKVTNGPTESLNKLIKRVKRIGFAFRNFRNYKVRALLTPAGRIGECSAPSWSDEARPRQNPKSLVHPESG
jgi:transposase